MSASAAARMRSTSRAMARCTGFRRGCAARWMRWSAACRADTSGCALPVSCDCCRARRREASRSWMRLSSRERESESISSSSWLRCKLTSDRRTSATPRRACSSCTWASACEATVRASTTCSSTSCARRASSAWVVFRRCQSMPAMTSAAAATSRASSVRPTAGRAECGASGGRLTGGGALGAGAATGAVSLSGAFMARRMPRILGRAPRRPM